MDNQKPDFLPDLSSFRPSGALLKESNMVKYEFDKFYPFQAGSS